MRVLILAYCIAAGALADGGNAPPIVRLDRYPDGRVHRAAEWRGSKLDGTTRGWYDDGAKMFDYRYRDGVAEGEQRQWYESGQPLTLFHDRAGHELGEQRMWNADGSVRSSYVVRDGRRYGLIGAMGCTGRDSTITGDTP